jgi:hypothetical protein
MSLRIFWLVWLVFPVITSAQQQGYPTFNHSIKPQYSERDYRQYRWRPLRGEADAIARPAMNAQGKANGLVQGYRIDRDPPLSWYRDSSLAQPQRYRFRSLSVKELERNRERIMVNRAASLPPRKMVFRPVEPSTRLSTGYSNKSQYRFRPDSQLDRASDYTIPLYTSEPWLNTNGSPSYHEGIETDHYRHTR